MQRPPTAKGTAFATLEDEFGFLDLILHKEVYERVRDLMMNEPFVVVRGKIQRDGGACSLIVEGIEPCLNREEEEIYAQIGAGTSMRTANAASDNFQGFPNQRESGRGPPLPMERNRGDVAAERALTREELQAAKIAGEKSSNARKCTGAETISL